MRGMQLTFETMRSVIGGKSDEHSLNCDIFGCPV